MSNLTQSQKEFERALKVIPTGIHGHLGPVAGCAIPNDAFPKFVSKAKGAYFWDVDGNQYIDYMCAYGPNILGYCDEDVDSAVIEQLKLGDCTTAPFTKMIDMAELLVDTVHSAHWAFFAKNGNDVTSLALMTAKAATGKKKTILIKGNYHGVSPWTQKLGEPGIVEEDIKNNLYIPWNDIQALNDVISENRNEIACLISTPYSHPVFYDNEKPAKDYWKQVRKLCTENDIVLIIDDVRCGFRLDLKGSDHYYGFEADLICFCKALGNGYNFSALCGKDSLKEAVSSVMYTGSYWLSAAPFAAGIATINKLKAIKGDKLVLEKGEKLTTSLIEIADYYGINLKISGESSMWYMRITNDDSLDLHQQWVAQCVQNGVYFTNHHNQFINCAISDQDIQKTLDVAGQAFKMVANNNPSLMYK